MFSIDNFINILCIALRRVSLGFAALVVEIGLLALWWYGCRMGYDVPVIAAAATGAIQRLIHEEVAALSMATGGYRCAIRS
jgi:hypothetical protein